MTCDTGACLLAPSRWWSLATIINLSHTCVFPKTGAERLQRFKSDFHPLTALWFEWCVSDNKRFQKAQARKTGFNGSRARHDVSFTRLGAAYVRGLRTGHQSVINRCLCGPRVTPLTWLWPLAHFSLSIKIFT